MDPKLMLMSPLFLYGIKPALHLLQLLMLLLFHLRILGSGHLLLHPVHLVHHVLHLLLLCRGHMTLPHHLTHLIHHLVHHVHVLHHALAHALTAHHGVTFGVHGSAVHLGG